jgi:hypothetical protein
LTATSNSPYEGICGQNSTKLTVRKCTDETCATYSDVQNVAFLIFSSGANYNNQTGASAAIKSAATQNIYDQLLLVDNYAADKNKTETYDDIVHYVTLDELRTKIGCTGSQLSIINNELPYITTGSPLSATLYAQGGSGSDYYQWCWKSDNFTWDFLCGDNLSRSSTCSPASGTWKKCKSLTSPGTNVTLNPFSYGITFYVKDNANNTSQKTLVLTINPN